ncbi:hypothetical protein LINPERHAP1_LOCUS16204, partial [Linum perenne]
MVEEVKHRPTEPLETNAECEVREIPTTIWDDELQPEQEVLAKRELAEFLGCNPKGEATSPRKVVGTTEVSTLDKSFSVVDPPKQVEALQDFGLMMKFLYQEIDNKSITPKVEEKTIEEPQQRPPEAISSPIGSLEMTKAIGGDTPYLL